MGLSWHGLGMALGTPRLSLSHQHAGCPSGMCHLQGRLRRKGSGAALASSAIRAEITPSEPSRKPGEQGIAGASCHLAERGSLEANVATACPAEPGWLLCLALLPPLGVPRLPLCPRAQRRRSVPPFLQAFPLGLAPELHPHRSSCTPRPSRCPHVLSLPPSATAGPPPLPVPAHGAGWKVQKPQLPALAPLHTIKRAKRDALPHLPPAPRGFPSHPSARLGGEAGVRKAPVQLLRVFQQF